MALNRKQELAYFFSNQIKILRCHYWNPKYSGCSCGNPDCATPGKHPMGLRGVYDAKAYKNPRELGNCNVGLATGHGINVLDIDPRNGGDKTLEALVAEYGPLPKTWRVATGGGGWHYYFAAPEGTPSNKALTKSGVEMQGLGAYVLMPTSIHQSGRDYEWDVSPEDCELAPLPDWILSVGQDGSAHESGDAANGMLRMYNFDDIVSLLAFVSPDCDRVTWRNIGWALRDAGISFEMFDDWSRKSEKYKGTKDCSILWGSYKPEGGIHAGTMFAIARKLGWTPPERSEILILEDEETTTEVTEETKTEKASQNFDEEPPEEWLNPDAFEDTRAPIEESVSEESKSTEQETPSPEKLDIDISRPQFDYAESCPDWPPGMTGIIAKRIYETAPSQHKQLAIATALSIVASVASMNYVTPIRRGSIASYMVLVASAAVGKEHYRSRAERIVEKISPLRTMSEPLSSQALRFLWVECNARAFNCDEILKWLSMIYDPRNQNGAKIVSDVLKVWALGSDVLKGYATKRQDDITPDVNIPSLTILGCGTEQRFRDLCSISDFAYDGLLSRVDAVFANHSTDTHHTPLDSTEFTLPEDVVRRLKSIAKAPKSVDFVISFQGFDGGGKKSATARESHIFSDRQPTEWENDDVPNKWREIFSECKARTAAQEREPIIESLWSRCAEKVARTATCLAIMENPYKPKISMEHMMWAWEWQQYVVEGMRQVIGVSKGSAAENLRASIRNAIKKITTEKLKNCAKEWDTATLREITRADRSISSADYRAVGDAIQYLEAEGFLALVQTANKRSKLRVRILPAT